jgi:hypothetical protein
MHGGLLWEQLPSSLPVFRLQATLRRHPSDTRVAQRAERPQGKLKVSIPLSYNRRPLLLLTIDRMTTTPTRASVRISSIFQCPSSRLPRLGRRGARSRATTLSTSHRRDSLISSPGGSESLHRLLHFSPIKTDPIFEYSVDSSEGTWRCRFDKESSGKARRLRRRSSGKRSQFVSRSSFTCFGSCMGTSANLSFAPLSI